MLIILHRLLKVHHKGLPNLQHGVAVPRLVVRVAQDDVPQPVVLVLELARPAGVAVGLLRRDERVLLYRRTPAGARPAGEGVVEEALVVLGRLRADVGLGGLVGGEVVEVGEVGDVDELAVQGIESVHFLDVEGVERGVSYSEVKRQMLLRNARSCCSCSRGSSPASRSSIGMRSGSRMAPYSASLCSSRSSREVSDGCSIALSAQKLPWEIACPGSWSATHLDFSGLVGARPQAETGEAGAHCSAAAWLIEVQALVSVV